MYVPKIDKSQLVGPKSYDFFLFQNHIQKPITEARKGILKQKTRRRKDADDAHLSLQTPSKTSNTDSTIFDVCHQVSVTHLRDLRPQRNHSSYLRKIVMTPQNQRISQCTRLLIQARGPISLHVHRPMRPVPLPPDLPLQNI